MVIAMRGSGEQGCTLPSPRPSPGGRGGLTLAPRSPRSSPPAKPRPTSSMRPCCRTSRATIARSPAARMPDCCGASSSMATSSRIGWRAIPKTPPPPERAQVGPQLRLAASLLSRRALDARQVGISLVRGLGPGVPHGPLGAARSGVRPGPVEPLSPRVVHASQRAVAGLRVRPGRRQSAGSRLGLLGSLPGDELRPKIPSRVFSRPRSRSC